MIWNKGEQKSWDRLTENFRRMDQGLPVKRMTWAEARETLENSEVPEERIETIRKLWVEEYGEDEES